MKILVIDIETRPSMGYIWSLWDQNVSLSQLVEVGEVICFAAKWIGKKRITFKSIYHHSKEEMVQTAWDLMDEADAIVHFNGRAFDIKHLKREFLLAKLNPPSPHKDIDLLTVCRSNFKFVSNKLDHVADQMGLGNKMSHSGFQLWVDCMANDPAAWKTMKEYNIQDILLTEELYYELFPWITNHPNAALYRDSDSEKDMFACTKCDSINLQKRGFAYTNASRFQQYYCNDCGSWNKDKQRDLGAALATSK